MFEYSSLQEAYTGALIAGKGKTLPNIGVIMERTRIPAEQWVRVRFGAGMPWKRCWCVIAPPDEKEYMKMQKELKKKSPYDRSHPPVLKGTIKFYDQKKEGKKNKKLQPIATITDSYSAYAIYPQAKSLVDASTLIKIEGNITIHADPPSSSEGFVFVMPEVGPALSGFGGLLKYLFPTWDTFGLYGRPGKLVASVLDARSLMFAMPKSKRYGYLEILDVSSLILTEGSSSWTEQDWRKKLKELTGSRMNNMDDAGSSSPPSRRDSPSKRLSFGAATGGPSRPRVGFADEPAAPATRSSRSFSLNSRPPLPDDIASGQHAPSPLGGARSRHSRNASDPSAPPQPPPHQDPYARTPLSGRGPNPAQNFVNDLASTPERTSSDSEPTPNYEVGEVATTRDMATPEPVSRPPRFSHAPNDKPANRPYHTPELRRATSRLSSTTLAQLAKAGGVSVDDNVYSNEAGYNDARSGPSLQQHDPRGPPPVLVHANASNDDGLSANAGSREALADNQYPRSPGLPSPQFALPNQRSRSPLNQNMGPPPSGPRGPSPGPPRSGTPGSRPSTPGDRPPPGRGGPPPGRGGPPPGGYPPRMPPPGRGQPPPNMAPGRGNPNYQPNMYNMYSGPPPRGPPQGPLPGPPGPRSPPPNRGPLPPLNTSPPIHRKPIPARGDSLQNRQNQNGVPESPSTSNDSFTAGSIDSNILRQIRPTADDADSPRAANSPRAAMFRHNTGQSGTSSRYDGSRYDDNASTDSPDYASSRPSTDTAPSIERPRAGVLRTVGDDGASSAGSVEMPSIDFGPTMNYAAMPRSKTPTGMVPPSRSYSPGPRSYSPAAATPGPRRSPNFDAGHNRQESEETVRRSMIWHPASPPSNSSGGHALSPEQFVQQRAAAAATPLYAHQRQSSNNSASGYRAGTPTPPLNAHQMGDYIGSGHARSSSQDLLQRPGSRGAGDLLQRPGSRGAGAVLGGQAGTEPHLSAREQEHVARVTGSPLINMAGNKNKNLPPIGGGLVGAIDAREREREQMKQGWGGQTVQHAINQRQQQQAYQQYQRPLASPPPSGMYSNMSPGPRSPPPQGYFPQHGGRGQEQSGWSSPGLAYSPSAFDPRFPPGQALSGPPGGQYAPSPPPHSQPGQQSGGYGQGSYYHGQAF